MAIDAEFSEVGSFDGTRLAWTAAGEGRSGVTVVLANGIVCTDTYWTYLFPYLADQGHRVVFWDYRAHGRSGPPADPDEVTLTAHARDLWAVADAAGAERVVLVGHSMGVQTILEAYRLHPDRVAGLVAIAGPFEDPGRTFYGGPLGQVVFPILEASVRPLPWVSRAVWRTLAAQGDLMYWSGRASWMIGGNASRELMGEYFAHLTTLDPLVALRMVTAMRAHSARDLLGSIRVPTLVLAGAKDVMTPARIATEMADAVSGARLEVLADGSHTLPIDDPETVDRLVEEFVRGVEDGPRPRRRRRRAPGPDASPS